MKLRFHINDGNDLIILVLDKDNNVIDNEVKNPEMCELFFKHGIPVDNESLKNFFLTNMGGNKDTKVEDYIEHIRNKGFYNPYERNLRVTVIE